MFKCMACTVLVFVLLVTLSIVSHAAFKEASDYPNLAVIFQENGGVYSLDSIPLAGLTDEQSKVFQLMKDRSLSSEYALLVQFFNLDLDPSKCEISIHLAYLPELTFRYTSSFAIYNASNSFGVSLRVSSDKVNISSLQHGDVSGSFNLFSSRPGYVVSDPNSIFRSKMPRESAFSDSVKFDIFGKTTVYPVKVKYQYADGSEAAGGVDRCFAQGETYDYGSPEIAGYAPDREVVSGMVTGEVSETVTYTPFPPVTNPVDFKLELSDFEAFLRMLLANLKVVLPILLTVAGVLLAVILVPHLVRRSTVGR